MKIRFKYNSRNNLLLGAMLVIALILFVMTDFAWWITLAFAAVFYLISSLEIELKEKLPWLYTVIIMGLGATFTMFSIQYMLLEWEDFMKTADIRLFTNVCIVLVLYLLIFIITANASISVLIGHILILFLAFVNYFVYQFRGNEFGIADIRAIGICFTIAGKYTYSINVRCAYVILASILFIALVCKFKIEFKNHIPMRIIAFLLMVISVLLIIYNSIGVITETWEQKGTYRNGYLLNLVLQVRDIRISKPDGYSADAVKQLEKIYAESEESMRDGFGNISSDVKEPTVIVIMNESFADLSVLGDFRTNFEVTPFIDSLKENTIKGYALASVYGAKTPNSEWEFETGNSMAFLPEGSVVYQQYIDDKPSSIVSTMKNAGYTTVAMHPYYETGWSRNTIYPKLGYDEMYFMDDFDTDNIIREYITDKEMYSKIIDRFNNKTKGEKLYIMGITMQNHGGYGESYDNFIERIYKVGTSYTDANQYLSLINESDAAVEELITYFKQVEEPVEIVFFGDHQPGLNTSFIELLNGKGLSGLTMEELENLYTVPFFIWTNYDSPAAEVKMTSLNYLSTLTLTRAGIKLPAYNEFLLDMMEEIPAMNSQGYYSMSQERYIHYNEASGREAEWLNKYNILQYNSMFGKKDKSKVFFP